MAGMYHRLMTAPSGRPVMPAPAAVHADPAAIMRSLPPAVQAMLARQSPQIGMARPGLPVQGAQAGPTPEQLQQLIQQSRPPMPGPGGAPPPVAPPAQTQQMGLSPEQLQQMQQMQRFGNG